MIVSRTVEAKKYVFFEFHKMFDDFRVKFLENHSNIDAKTDNMRFGIENRDVLS